MDIVDKIMFRIINSLNSSVLVNNSPTSSLSLGRD